ncbi:MAG: peptidoglycan-binding domain-containing protein [Jatrophihabitans sp.]
MSSADDYPDLVIGDANDWVVELQLRLHTLGVYPGCCDGILGERTVAAIRDFTLAYQVSVNEGETMIVGRQVWAALLSLAPAETPPEDSGAPVEGQLSDDQTWVWHDASWYPAEVIESAGRPDADLVTDSDYQGQLSEDGHWRWVDNRWQPNA